MNNRELDRLLRAVQVGDNKAFEVFYLQTKKGVYSFLYTYLHHHEDTEDAMQTVYLKVKRNIEKYKAGTNARAWLLQIAKNHALNEIKKASRTIYTDNLDWVEDTAVTESEGVFDIVKRKLSEEEQRIVFLHILWNYKHREIGEILGCPTGTITSKYKRAIEKLKVELKGK